MANIITTSERSKKPRFLSTRGRRVFFSLLIIMVVSLSALAVYLIFSTSQSSKPDEEDSFELSQEQLNYAMERVGVTGTVVSLNETTRTIVLLTDDEQEAFYHYNDETTVHVGVAAEPDSIDSLTAGLTVAINYNTSTKLIEDIWYDEQ